jgi:hypothetical protein
MNNDPNHHFVGAAKQIEFGKGAIQMVEDYHLSRFACYLIAQNGDPRKPEIAQAKIYSLNLALLEALRCEKLKGSRRGL